jgi:hypothetical protein
MTKTLSMVIHKNYNLLSTEGFVMFLTSKLITCFTNCFILIMPNKLLIYSMKVNIYIGLWTLNVKCSQHGIRG